MPTPEMRDSKKEKLSRRKQVPSTAPEHLDLDGYADEILEFGKELDDQDLQEEGMQKNREHGI
ncbi:MAG: hypothetical protein AB7O96_06665 [Pseudobdellovibrionaceae bacterium]